MYLKEYSIELKDIWNQFIEDSKNGTFLFNRNYMDYHNDRFNDNSLLFYDDRNRLISVLPANIKDHTLYTHQGLTYGGLISSIRLTIDHTEKIFNCLIEYCKKKDIKKIIYKKIPYIYEKLPSDEDLYILNQINAKLIRREISTAVALKKPYKLSSGKKSKIKKSKSQKIVIKKNNSSKKTLELLNEVLKNKYTTHATHLHQELDLLITKFNNITCHEISLEEEVLAGIISYNCNKCVHIQYMASNETGKKHGALDTLIFFLMTEYFTEATYFDFGISTENKGTYLNRGLINQKEEFGGRGVCYDTYQIDINKESI